ncbi:Fructan 6-exohydrolase-like protein [Drosera capensis]
MWVNLLTHILNRKDGRGIHATPRAIVLDKLGKQLVQWPVKELETLRERAVHITGKLLKQGSLLEVPNITAAQADLEVTFRISKLKEAEEKFDPKWTDPQLLCSQKEARVKGVVGPFGLFTLVSKGLEEYTAVCFRIFKDGGKYVVLMCSDQSRSSLDSTKDKTTYGTFVGVVPLHEKLSLRTLFSYLIPYPRI